MLRTDEKILKLVSKEQLQRIEESFHNTHRKLEDDFDMMQKFMREINIKFTDTQNKLMKTIEINTGRLAELKDIGNLGNSEAVSSIPPEVVEMLTKS